MLVYTSQGDVASAVSRHPEKHGGNQLTFPWCLPGPGGARSGEISDQKAEWNQTDGFVGKGVEVEKKGGGWIRSGGPCSWSFSATVHSWKELDICSSEMMDGLLDRVRAEW